MSKCATCWRDPATKGWHDPGNHRPRGTSDSNWVCRRCRKKSINRAWHCTPAEEAYGIEYESGEDRRPEPDSAPGKYETPLCIEIMRLHCLGVSQRGISKHVRCELKYVYRTVTYWKNNYGYFLDNLKGLLKINGVA